ncbi:MAG: hypothetical protein LRY57_03300 [Alphaproteobacteria bacterium]|nr:hypothetical protein [Alphaproteobacteria bacterium]
MIIHKLSISLVSLMVFMVMGAAAEAQQCTIVPNTLATLTRPADTDPTIWSMDGGDRNLTDRFVSGMIDEADGNIIVLGARYYNMGENVSLTLRKLDNRGRTVWEKIFSNRGFENIIKIVPLEKGFMVLAGKGGRKVTSTGWVGFFDAEGNLTADQTIKPPSGAFVPMDILPLNNATAFLLTGQVTSGSDAPYTVLYRLNRKGVITSRKAYQMGLENALMSLAVAKGGFVYGSGFILDKNKRKNAWIVKLTAEGGIVWQRQFARGRAAELIHLAPYGDGYVMAGGFSKPYDLKTPESRNIGGWVALFAGGNGDLAWERFYSEPDHDITIRDFIVHEDSQISVLMDAAKNMNSAAEADPFTRLVSLNGRGSMLESAVYMHGRGADGMALITGAQNQRIIMGGALAAYTVMADDPEDPDDEPQEKNALARQGWAIAVPGITPYEDPCAGE